MNFLVTKALNAINQTKEFRLIFTVIDQTFESTSCRNQTEPVWFNEFLILIPVNEGSSHHSPPGPPPLNEWISFIQTWAESETSCD